MSCKTNKFRFSAPTWNEEFELPAESCSVSDIYIKKAWRKNS